jgi:hypothetical protein
MECRRVAWGIVFSMVCDCEFERWVEGMVEEGGKKREIGRDRSKL